MSLWQFQAASAGYAEAHDSESERPMDDAEFTEAAAMLDAMPDTTD